MILIGVYPNCFETNGIKSPLSNLSELLDKIIPKGVAIHLLPFNPSNGDGGFAPNDWFKVDENLGTWEDIRKITNKRKLIVDCIYNHVGFDHPYVKEFIENPLLGSDKLHVFKNEINELVPRSPRGGLVLNELLINEQKWQLWQTFSEYSIDIQLKHPIIKTEIEQHLSFLRQMNIWGVRLDGMAYYGKGFGINSNRYHPDSYVHSREIANMALKKSLSVIAQLDCVKEGIAYFPKELGYDVPIVDYSYSAHLSYALLSGKVDLFCKHLNKTMNMNLIRCPRTHDGILLRSDNIPETGKREMVFVGEKSGLKVRLIDRIPYEFNCSFPFLCSIGGELLKFEKIFLSIAITCFLPGISYIYLPFMIGFVPEKYYEFENDPRLLNRKPIPISYWKDFLSTNEKNILYSLINWFDLLYSRIGDDEKMKFGSIVNMDDGLISITKCDSKLQLLANFNKTIDFNLKDKVNGKWIFGLNSSHKHISPFGFGIWEKQ